MAWTRESFLDETVRYNIWMPMVKVTNWCDDNCDFCCECSGTNQPKITIPEKDVMEIADQFKVETGLSDIIITGGDPTSPYRWGDNKYFPTLCRGLLAKGMRINIKTNCNWTLCPKLSGRIYADLETFQPLDAGHWFFIFLSLDLHHKKSTKTTIEFLRWYTTSEKVSQNFAPFIFWGDKDQFVEVWMTLDRGHNIRIDFEKKDPLYPERTFLVNRNTGAERFIFLKHSSEVDNIGRAKINNLPSKPVKTLVEKIESLSFFSTVDIQYDQNGIATLFSCGDYGITAPYKKAGKLKPLPELRTELLNKAFDKYEFLIQSQGK